MIRWAGYRTVGAVPTIAAIPRRIALANNSYLHERVLPDAAEALDRQIELQTRIANRIKSLSATLHPLALSD